MFFVTWKTWDVLISCLWNCASRIFRCDEILRRHLGTNWKYIAFRYILFGLRSGWIRKFGSSHSNQLYMLSNGMYRYLKDRDNFTLEHIDLWITLYYLSVYKRNLAFFRSFWQKFSKMFVSRALTFVSQCVQIYLTRDATGGNITLHSTHVMQDDVIKGKYFPRY